MAAVDAGSSLVTVVTVVTTGARGDGSGRCWVVAGDRDCVVTTGARGDGSGRCWVVAGDRGDRGDDRCWRRWQRSMLGRRR